MVMKTNVKKVLVWLGLTLAMMALWILGLQIGDAIFPSDLMDQSVESSNAELLFFVVCGLNTSVILYFIQYSRVRGWKLAGLIFYISFAIQYFMSQIETLWFNDSLGLPINGIWAIVTGGFVTTGAFAILSTWATGNFRKSGNSVEPPAFNKTQMAKRVLILFILVWPLIYFTAGYFTAWQFPAVRLQYTGTDAMAPFTEIMIANLSSGLYYFQILRGFLWILIALPVLLYSEGNYLKKGLIIGLLFTVLGCSGLLIPNPVMPFMVRMGHLLETSTENFLWGFTIAWYLKKAFVSDNNPKIDEYSVHQNSLIT